MASAANCKGPHSTIAIFHKDTPDIIRKHVYEILWHHFIESKCIHDSAFAHRIVRHFNYFYTKNALQFFISSLLTFYRTAFIGLSAFYIVGARKNPWLASIFLLGSAGTITGGLTKRNSLGLGI